MKALLLIDVQNDFMPGGNLPVTEGDQIVAIVNELQAHFDLVIASQDWHPSEHLSFARNHLRHKAFEEIELNGLPQTLWPEHCVQDTVGAEFHADLDMRKIAAIFRKGMNPKIDSYSAFYDNGHVQSTGLSGYLKELGVEHLYFTGLAADFCVYFSIKDALKAGFKCTLIEDATRAIDVDNFKKLRQQLREDGVSIITSNNV
ncbi:bifunctional nicotinamidase/pyrazinamidase [Marinicella gelatinilytica]|uniref:bifunctional nicotinamidase/pyrazinamidase n=1 Tax=Marinicella gelatinilytica TaxID=2996017 RepID=UPI002260B978|nr:bifunctional nicotinamidase/pyrazinamidase [Marinicella gelatinilytica]MCX7545999.1 bifunctional nicotinamidase/pyrazinamidase [Marinicella gelatinilytica]